MSKPLGKYANLNNASKSVWTPGYTQQYVNSQIGVRNKPKSPPDICPECNGYIPSNVEPGAYPGAISRVDNKTEICSACGDKQIGMLRPGEKWEERFGNLTREQVADIVRASAQ